MKKQRKIIGLIIIAIVLLIIGLVFTIGKFWNKDKIKDTQVDYLEVDEVVLYNCKQSDDMDCALNYMTYNTYSYKDDNKAINELFEQLNAATKERLENDQKDLVSNYPECEPYLDVHKYRNMTSNFIYYYEATDRDVISITNEITYMDFCTRNSTVQLDVYTYSKKNKDFIINEDEMFDCFEYSKEQVNEMIVNYQKMFDIEVDPSKITEYRLFYNSHGQLIINYKYDGGNDWIMAKNES